jgi:sulfur relay protein TusB/DsrH
LTELTRRVRIYALQPDVLARGFAGEELIKEIQLLDYLGFVTLALAYPTIVPWS